MKRRLDFAIIGAQKSATTWLTHTNADHPDVLLPCYEIPCFERGFRDVDPLDGLAPDLGRYDVVGIKNNNLLFKPESPKLLRGHSQDIKLLLTLRDPIERLISSYYWHMRVGKLPVQPPEVGLREAIHNESVTLLGPGFYGRQLERYIKIFGRSQIKVTLFEDIKCRPRETLRSVYSFLNIDPDLKPESFDTRPKSSIYSLVRLKWNNIRNPFVRYEHESSGRMLRKESVNPFEWTVNALVVGVDQIILSRLCDNGRPLISESLRREIAEIYAPDCAHLRSLINRDLSGWEVVNIANL